MRVKRSISFLLGAGIAIVLLVAAEYDVHPLAEGQGPPAASIDPFSLDFGRQVVGTTSRSKRIVVTNTGGKRLNINDVEITGDDADDFSVAADKCTGATVTAGRACTIDVAYTPSDRDDSNASLKITDNAPDTPQSVNLSGTGINPEDVPPFE